MSSRIILRRTSTRCSTRTARMLDDICRRCAAERTRRGAAQPAGLFSCFPATTSSSSSGVLSGGERNRYAMAQMLLHRPRISCCWTSRRTIWICARKTFCWMRLQKFTGTVRLRLARPLLHRRAGDAGLRGGGRRGARVSRELRGLSLEEGECRRCGSSFASFRKAEGCGTGVCALQRSSH